MDWKTATIFGWMDDLMGGWMHARTCAWLDVCRFVCVVAVDRNVGGREDGQLHGWMGGGLVDEQTGG